MIGFAVVLTLLAVLSALSYHGFGNVSEGFGAFNQRVKVVGIVRDVDHGFMHTVGTFANSLCSATKS